MANKNLISQTLSINVENGFDDDGDVILKSCSYSGIKPDATADNLLKAANALGGLMANAVHAFMVTEKSELTEATEA